MGDDDVRRLDELDRTQIGVAGGKGAHLGELQRIEGVDVPAGFCVMTAAFERLLRGAPTVDEQLEHLSGVDPDDQQAIRSASAAVRSTLEATPVHDDVVAAIAAEVARLGEDDAYAVRSSATAEDLPTASFAGQQDTFLNVVGTAAIVEAVRRCWASLFTERAVTYRARNDIDHRSVRMAVVVQRMVRPRVSGILFTADPVTGNRTVSSVEASYGLGEALVSGLVTPDSYQVRDGQVVARAVATKPIAIHAAPSGGTRQQAVEPGERDRPALADAEVLRLAALGRRIEAHFGRPQDVEWCLAGDDVQIVQSRPITTLFPIPDADDDGNRVYVSVGHQQMMTDAMKPLGLSFWQMTTPRPMAEAGGRLFVDVTAALASPVTRAGLLGALGTSDPLIGDALQTIVEREGFLPPASGEPPAAPPVTGGAEPIDTDPGIVAELIAQTRASIAAAAQDIGGRSGPDLFDTIRADIGELRRFLFDPQSLRMIMAGMEASRWLNDQLLAWLGERGAADTLAQSVDHNVTAEMGLALLDVADAIRPHPDVVAFLREVDDDDFLDELAALRGGQQARAAIDSFLDSYGMRCVGEIDITRPRWRERPSTLVPAILGNVDNFEAGARSRRFEQGLQQARAKEQEVLARLAELPDGAGKAAEAKRMIDRVRAFSGFREHPKYGMVCRYFVYKQALLAEADRLVRAGVLRAPDDAFFLTFDELHDVVCTGRADHELVARRREEHRTNESLTPPRVLTSEGEAVAGSYRRANVPSGSLIGLAVSAGTVEGRARVVHDIADADLEAGDILVTAYTDPSWSPLFVAIAGLVTEVGGLMTHGAVIAREYGLPAIVGVDRATRVIRDGQRIRVHGTDGYVELLE
jgi:pyruvate,water dikinase